MAAKRTFTVPGPWPLCFHSFWLSYLPYRSQKAHRRRGVQEALDPLSPDAHPQNKQRLCHRCRGTFACAYWCIDLRHSCGLGATTCGRRRRLLPTSPSRTSATTNVPAPVVRSPEQLITVIKTFVADPLSARPTSRRKKRVHRAAASVAVVALPLLGAAVGMRPVRSRSTCAHVLVCTCAGSCRTTRVVPLS